MEQLFWDQRVKGQVTGNENEKINPLWMSSLFTTDGSNQKHHHPVPYVTVQNA